MNASSPLSARSTLVVGFDGLGPERSKRLAAEGKLPTISRWVKQGQAFRLTTTEPNDPTVLWADLAAGTPAVYHGLLAAATLEADGLRSVTQDDWGCPPLWQAASEAGRRTVVVNWPGSSQAASNPKSDTADRLTVVSDVELNEPPAEGAANPRNRRLAARDIDSDLVTELAGPFASAVRGWPADDRRMVCLRAALARAATIQNAVLDAIRAAVPTPLECLWVRYDLVETLARLLLPRPGLFFYDGHDTPDGFEATLLDRAAVLVDAMADAVWRAMPASTAVLAVGLLDYAADHFLDPRDVHRPSPGESELDGVRVRRDLRTYTATQRPGGFAAWLDPDLPPATDAAVRPAVIHELQRWPRERLGVEATPRRRADPAAHAIGLTSAVKRRRAARALGLTDAAPETRAAEDALIERRVLNLARCATAHRRWHSAANAWRIVVDLQDRFLHHLGLLDALVRADLLEEFDRRMLAWLRRLPDHPWLRRLVETRQAKPPGPMVAFPLADAGSIFTRKPAAAPDAMATPWTDLTPDGWDACRRDHAGALAACRAAYRRFADAWDNMDPACTAGPFAPSTADTPPPTAAQRHARAVAGPQSFAARHESPQERVSPAAADEIVIAHEPFTEDWLHELHRSQYRSPDELIHTGRYRSQDFTAGSLTVRLDGSAVGGDRFAPSAELPRLTRAMLDQTRRWIDHDPEAGPIIASVACLGVLKIHPFADGNGRTGRHLFREVLRATGFELVDRLDFSQWFERRREPYLATLSLIPHGGPHGLAPDVRRQYLDAYLAWWLGFLTHAIDEATRAVETLAHESANPETAR